MWKPTSQDQPRRITSIIHGQGPSGELAGKVRILVRVERAVHRILGESSAPHVRAAGVSGRTLTLVADSPAWASITRFRAPAICDALRSVLPAIRDARVIVGEPEDSAGFPPAEAFRPLAPSAARALRSAAGSIENPRLARVLIRLASRERPPAGGASASEPPSFEVNRP